MRSIFTIAIMLSSLSVMAQSNPKYKLDSSMVIRQVPHYDLFIDSIVDGKVISSRIERDYNFSRPPYGSGFIKIKHNYLFK